MTINDQQQLGSLVCKWRKEKNLTLRELGEQIGVSAGYISQIEHGRVSPSISTLKKLAKALDRRTIDFFMDELVEDPVVMHEEDWTQVNIPGWRARVRQLVRLVGDKKMQPFYTMIEPGGGTREKYTHPGEEFGIVIKGEMTLKLDNEVHIIRALSSFYYSSLIPHAWTNEGDETCCVVWVISPPSW